jgi:LytS/YehU family sensor histidine kinase
MEIAASLVNLLGFALGTSLYLLLLVMVVYYRDRPFNYLIFSTAVAGILWNLGEMTDSLWQGFYYEPSPVLIPTVSFSALGFLLAVVTHSALKDDESNLSKILIVCGYLFSLTATFLNIHALFSGAQVPSKLSLQVLIVGTASLLASSIFLNLSENANKKLMMLAGLSIFLTSLVHLSGETEEKFWFVELFAHQSSMPLAIMILLQDYRFAFADLFLKRALSLILIAFVSLLLYMFIALPIQKYLNPTQSTAILLSLWIFTAMLYPFLNRQAVKIVEKILRRADWETVKEQIKESIEALDSVDLILDSLCDKLMKTLLAKKADWREIQEHPVSLPDVICSQKGVQILIPTTDAPSYALTLENLAGGRKLLSEEIEALKTLALIVGRKIDSQRVTHERCEQEIREQEFSKLATEAQLAALRAQINPHFLFNTLTTIGYLIQSSPEKALTTLIRLTELLRAVLRSTDEFIPLSDEIKLVQTYLDIEKARFEERLETCIEVPADLERIKIPSLILQPLVENAIKHGISKSKTGGEVKISAKRIIQNSQDFLLLTVLDNGYGFDESELRKSGRKGIGLANIEQRLKNYYKGKAELRIETKKQVGTKAQIILPIAYKNDFADVT